MSNEWKQNGTSFLQLDPLLFLRGHMGRHDTSVRSCSGVTLYSVVLVGHPPPEEGADRCMGDEIVARAH